MSFVQLADERGIASAKAHVDQLYWDMVPDDVVLAPIPADLNGIFQLLPRRGLEPMLVGRLLALFPMRPIERALIAFDVLRGSLLGRHDDDLRVRLSFELAPLKRLAPLGSVAIPRDRIATLVEALSRSPSDETTSSLGGLVALSRTRSHLRDLPTIVDATFDLIKVLSLAHLPFRKCVPNSCAVSPASSGTSRTIQKCGAHSRTSWEMWRSKRRCNAD